jgi:hypothetical protein
VADANIGNNEIVGYLNEAGNQIVWRLRTSTGVLKTAALAIA